MLKQLVALVAGSIVIVLSMSYAQDAIQLLVSAHNWIAQLLTDVFSVGQAGNLARGLIALLSMPVLLGAIPTLAYWIIKRSWFPYFMEIVWVVWLIQAGALIIMYKV